MLPRVPKPSRIYIQQSRALHLVHNLFMANLNQDSARQLASISPKTYPSADDVLLKLIDEESAEVATMTLSQALQNLKPLSYLAAKGRGTYCIQTFPTPKVKKPIKNTPGTYKPWVRAGRGKEFHITTSCTPQRFDHVLRTSYQYILEGDRMEFHLHQKIQDNKNRTVDWALENCMHLRPDSILAAMPTGTTMLAEPATTDLSYKKKLPIQFEIIQSQVMWAMENAKALNEAKVITPEYIKRLGRWSKKQPTLVRRAQDVNEIANPSEEKESTMRNGTIATRIST